MLRFEYLMLRGQDARPVPSADTYSFVSTAKEKLEILSGAAPPQVLIFFEGEFPSRIWRRDGFELIEIILNWEK